MKKHISTDIYWLERIGIRIHLPNKPKLTAMKKILVLAIGLLFTVAVNAQDKKMWLSGSMSISSVTPNDQVDTKISNMSFGPGFGYWINENLTVGLGLGLSGLKTTDGIEEIGLDLDGDGSEEFLAYDTKKENQILIAPFMRYYKGIGDNFKLYGQVTIGIGSGTTSWEGVLINGVEGADFDVDDVKFSTLGLNVAPGIQYWFSDNWSMNAEIGVLGYNSRTDKDAGINEDGEEVDVKSSSIDLGLGLNNIRFGMNYHF